MLDREIRQGWCSHCQAQTTPFLNLIGREWSTKVSSLPLTTGAQLCHSGLLFNRRCIPCGSIRDDQLVYVCFKLPRLMSDHLHDRLFGYLMRCSGESCNLRTLLSSLLCSACTLFIYPMARRRTVASAHCGCKVSSYLCVMAFKSQYHAKKGLRALS
jgi:hypothetical protein